MLRPDAVRISRRDWFRLGALVIPSGLCANRLVAGQEKDESEPKFSSDVSVVNVLVSVRDKQGKIVHDLTKDDFTIEDESRPQTIKYFAQQSDLPLTLGLLIDTSESQRRLIDQERNASRDFFQHVLREDKDKAFVIHFDREVELLQDLTSSRKELNVALDQVEASRPQLNRRDSGDSRGDGGDPDRRGGTGYPQDRRGGMGGRGGTALYDSILLGSDELMKKQRGRKSMIVLSDGVDRGSRVSLREAIESAQRSDTLVYTIRFADSQPLGDRRGGFGGPNIGMGGGGIGGIGGMGGGRRGGNGGGNRGGNREPENRVDGKKILEQIARETGAGYFDVSSKMTLDKIYDRIEEDLRNQYSLGFAPAEASGGYHRIHVTTKAKNAVLQTREGYYSR